MNPRFFALVCLLVVASGCTSNSSPDVMYVCPDGQLVVKSLDQCPEKNYVCWDKTVVDDPEECPEHEEEDDKGQSEEDVCKNIPLAGYSSTSTRDNCYSNLANTRMDAKYCGRISSTYTRSSCYSNLALTLDNYSICKSAGASRDDCYNSIARKQHDVDVCDEIDSSYGRDNCYLGMLYNIREESLCEKISNTGRRDSCYSNLAGYEYDTTKCGKIKNAYTKDNCIKNVAYKLRDASLCEQTSSSSSLRACIEYVNRTRYY